MSGFVSARWPVALGWSRARSARGRAADRAGLAPGLARGERVLIRGATADGGECVASDRALLYRVGPANRTGSAGRRSRWWAGGGPTG
jgi:hypothetical protein